MAWYIENGPKEETVLSTRVRIARNLEDMPFPNRMNPEQEKETEKLIENTFLSLNISRPRSNWSIVRLEEMGKMQKLTLAEKHLLSKRMLEPGCGKTLIINKEENLSIMILEEDHIRVQAMSAGLDLAKAYKEATDLTYGLEDKIPMAWNDDYGFLTACPTNTGTGLRASVMLFLPGLIRTDRMRYMSDMLSKAGYAVRGSSGEGSKVMGYKVQVSNQLTLGLSEEEILRDLQHLVENLIEKEEESRSKLLQADKLGMEDKVWRARGILENARRINYEEAVNLLADLRLGVSLGLINDGLSLVSLNRVDTNIGNASLQQISGKELIDCELDEGRARLIRDELKGANRRSR